MYLVVGCGNDKNRKKKYSNEKNKNLWYDKKRKKKYSNEV